MPGWITVLELVPGLLQRNLKLINVLSVLLLLVSLSIRLFVARIAANPL